MVGRLIPQHHLVWTRKTQCESNLTLLTTRQCDHRLREVFQAKAFQVAHVRCVESVFAAFVEDRVEFLLLAQQLLKITFAQRKFLADVMQARLHSLPLRVVLVEIVFETQLPRGQNLLGNVKDREVTVAVVDKRRHGGVRCLQPHHDFEE